MKNLIRKILREESEWWEDTIKEFNPSPAEEWLFNLMKSLTITPSERNPGLMLYKNPKGQTLMADDIDQGGKNHFLYVSDSKIWSKLSKEFDFDRQEIKDLCVRMLEMTHKRKVFTTYPEEFH